MQEHDAPDHEVAHNAIFEFDQTDVYGKYMLHSRAEILFVLRSMEKHGTRITVYFDHGQSFLLTALLAIEDDGRLVFDYGSDQEMNAKALKADRLLCTGSLDRVKVQFSLNGLSQTKFDGRPAFAAKAPAAILRLQRREYFRLETPHANPIICRATARREDDSTFPLNLPLVDISGGGLGLSAPLDADAYCKIGTLFSNCSITIPEEGLLQANLIVRSIFRIKAKNGHESLRIGCEFVNLPGQRVNMIQRYITRVERERKARLGWE